MTLLSQLQKWPQFQAIYTSRTAVSVGQFCVLRYVGFLHQVAICIDKGVLGSASGDTFDQVLNKSFLLFLIRVNSLVALLGLYSCQSGFFFHLGTFEKNLGFSSFYALSGNSVLSTVGSSQATQQHRSPQAVCGGCSLHWPACVVHALCTGLPFPSKKKEAILE